MSDATRRALRGFLQLLASGGITEFVDLVIVNLTPSQKALVLAGTHLLVIWAQNSLEDNTRFPAILKAPASSGVNPEP